MSAKIAENTPKFPMLLFCILHPRNQTHPLCRPPWRHYRHIPGTGLSLRTTGILGGFFDGIILNHLGLSREKNSVEKPVKNPIDQFNGRSTCTYCNSELFSHQKKLVSQRAIELQRRRWCLSGVPAWGCKNEMENIYKKGIVTSIQRICRREFPCFFRLSEINITPVVVDARWQQVVRKWSENGWKKSKI